MKLAGRTADMMVVDDLEPTPVASVPAATSAAPISPVVEAQAPPAADPWQAFLSQSQAAQAARRPVAPEDLQFGRAGAQQASPVLAVPDFMATVSQAGAYRRPDFQSFAGMKRWV